MANGDEENVSKRASNDTSSKQNGVPLVFLREESLFGKRKPSFNEFLKHEELYTGLSNVIEPSHITGLQRVNGMWRIYLDNLTDKAKLITEGVTIRGHSLPILQTNPQRLDYENTTRIRVQNIPLSVDDSTITRPLILKGIDIISNTREKLRINGKLTNCETGDRLVLVKTSSLKEPLNRFMQFGSFKAKVLHWGQNKTTTTALKCYKCLGTGHTIATCEFDWTCTQCRKPGHKKGSCPMNDSTLSDNSESTDNEDESSDSSYTVKQNTNVPNTKSRVNTDAKNTETNDTPVKNRTIKKRKGRKHKQADIPKGQTRLENFMQQNDTPNQKKNKTLERSPPTPAEMLHDNSKKSRNANSEYDSD